MKIPCLVAALVAAVALAGPAEAAAKKRHKTVHRAKIGAMHSPAQAQGTDVYVNGEYIGRDPDPNIRSFMIRNPHIWDGPM